MAKKPSNSQKRLKSTLPFDIKKIPNYSSLTIYRMEASPFYYVREYAGGKIYRRSTKTANRSEAIKFAKEFFITQRLAELNKTPLGKKSGFEVCAWARLDEVKSLVENKDLSKQKYEGDRARLENDILPFFKQYEVAEIDYIKINAYITAIRAKRPLSNSSLRVHLSHIKTILNYAQRMGVITALPAFPKLKTVDKPRPWFNSKEYLKLHSRARICAKQGYSFKIPSKTKNRNTFMRSGYPPK